MALRHVLLGLLVDRPDHAYALKHRLSPGLPREQLVNDGVLYPLLAKLETDGLVTSSERPGRAGRPRRVYSVTARGRAEFGRWLRSEDDEDGPPLYELFVAQPLVKLLFAKHLTAGELQGKLHSQAERVARRITAFEALASIAPAEATAASAKRCSTSSCASCTTAWNGCATPTGRTLSARTPRVSAHARCGPHRG